MFENWSFLPRRYSLACMFYRVYARASDIRRKFLVWMLRARANGLYRSSSTLPERNAPGRCVKRVYASARPFRHYTIRRCNCQLVVPGANFLVARPFERALCSTVQRFFRYVDLVWRLSENDKERNLFLLNMIKGVDDRFFLPPPPSIVVWPHKATYHVSISIFYAEN